MIKGADNIVNTASLSSIGEPSVSLILTRQLAEGSLGMVQEYEPSSSVLATTSAHVEPSVLYSIWTNPLVLTEDHVIS